MKPLTRFFIFSLILATLCGCGSKTREPVVENEPVAPVSQSIKIKVADVSNETGQLFDVDIIGLLWNSIDESLKKRGYLPITPPLEPPMTIEAHIIQYQKGSIWLRPVLPPLGKTLLSVKCDLKQQGRIIASVESKQTISLGSGTLTTDAWRKIFKGVAEDVVMQFLRKI